jgi:hypothetical protein
MADAVSAAALQVDRLAVESRLRIAELADADDKLNARIEALVSAIGQLIAKE